MINNVETLANMSQIIVRGGEWFCEIGMGKSKGTKVFAVTGKVKHAGLVEVPMGMTLRDVVDDICGGVGLERPDQGRPDRRPLRRRDPGQRARHAGHLREPAASSARSWARAA